MARRKRALRSVPEHWQISTEMRINGRVVVPGVEVRVTGQRGRFRFESHTRTPTAEWITVRDADGRWRSFTPAAVRTVHRTQRMRPAA